MPTLKPHLEFHRLDLTQGFVAQPGYPPGFAEKILASNLDEANKRGSKTRLFRIDPGAFTTEPVVHEYWEEVWVVEGEMIVGDAASGIERYTAPTYACRPPGAAHGPFRSETGCLLLEFAWFKDAEGG